MSRHADLRARLFHYGRTSTLVWYAGRDGHEDELLGMVVRGPDGAVYEGSQSSPGHSWEDMQCSASGTLCMLQLALEAEDVDELLDTTFLDRPEAVRVFDAARQFGILLEEAATIAIDETVRIEEAHRRSD